MRLKKSLPVLTCTLLLLLPAGVFGAGPMNLAAFDDTTIGQRLSFLEERLDAGQNHARYWQYGWTGFYAASTTAQTALWLDANNNDDSINYVAGAVKSAGGLIDLLLRPMPGRFGADRVRSMSGSSLEKLGKAEDILDAAALRAEERNTWKPHIKVIGVNLLAGAAILAWGDDGDALASTLTGIAVGEANIWTQPTRAIDDRRDYIDQFNNRRGLGGIDWRVLPMPGGLMVHGSF